MTQQAETGAAIAEKCERPCGSKVDRRFKMVQDIRGEIIAMLAAKRRGFSVDDYQFLGRLGILDEDDRIELIDGEIVLMSPIGDRHLACVDMLASQLFNGVAGQAIVRVQGSIRLGNDSEPQPDIVLLRPRDDFYASRSAGPDDILLVVEVANTSLYYDRQKTAETYAKHRIPEVWIANLTEDCVERYFNPTENGYVEMTRFTSGDAIALALLPDVELAIDDILPQGSA